MANYLYRRGDGNEGDFPRFLVTLKPGDSPYAALEALVVNDYIAGRKVRRHVARCIEIGGEGDTLYAVVYEGPEGETAFGAAWLTASLERIADDEPGDASRSQYLLRRILDRGALNLFRKANRK